MDGSSPSSARAGFAVLFTATLLWLGGCADAGSPAGSGGIAGARVDPALKLSLGTSAAQVENLTGRPAVSRPAVSRPVRSAEMEIVAWVYRRPRPGRAETVAASMEQVPWIDPIAGKLKMIEEPVLTEQRIEDTEELFVDMGSGQVVGVHRSILRSRRLGG